MSGIVDCLRDAEHLPGGAESADSCVIVRHRDAQRAAAMLEFFLGQMQMCSPKMNGEHSYRLISSGWPMTHLKGPSAEAAVEAAIAEVERARRERRAKGGES